MLLKHFDRIIVISLPGRADRRDRLIQNLKDCHLATAEDLTWLEAVDGRKEAIPDWWKAGAGAWGCRFSQLKAIKEAQRDGLENVLVLEDDAVFHPRAGEWLDDVMPLLPDDWGQFFLGGQHMRPPEPSDHPKLLTGRCITRTHAYAVHQQLYQTLIDLIEDDEDYRANVGRHIDHQFAEQQLKGAWKTYVPAWWFAGQNEGLSDIANCEPFPQRWWQIGNHYWRLPFIKIGKTREASYRDKVYISDEDPPAKRSEQILWLRRVARASWDRGLLPSCPASIDLPDALWPGGFVSPSTSLTEIKRLADFPANGIFDHPFSRQLKS